MIFGRLRTHNYGHTLSPVEVEDSTFFYLARPDGSALKLVTEGDHWRTENGGQEVLSVTPDGEGWVLATASGDRQFYSDSGLLTRIVYKDGDRIDLAYDSKGRLATVTDASGRAMRYAYTSAGLVESIAVPDGGAIRMAYRANIDLARVTYQDGSSVSYLYEEVPYTGNATKRGLLSGVIDEAGERSSSTWYDRTQRAYRVSRSAGVEDFTITYPTATNDKIVRIASSSGSTRQLHYADMARRRVVTGSTETCEGCAESQVTYGYDSHGRIISSRKPRTSDQYVYGEGGRVVSRKHASEENGTFTIQYDRVADPEGGAYAVRDRSGKLLRSRAVEFDSQRRIVGIVESAEGTSRHQRFEYCQPGAANCPFDWLKSRSISATGAVLTFQYYNADDAGCAMVAGTCRFRRGDLQRMTASDGATIEVTSYDGAGRVTAMVDQHGVTSTFIYSPRGQLVSSRQVAAGFADRTRSYAYGPTGSLATFAASDMGAITLAYDASQRLSSVTDSAGNVLRLERDSVGNILKQEVRDASGTVRRLMSLAYDGLSRLAYVEDSPGNADEFLHDDNGNVTSSVDPLGTLDQRSYDDTNRLLQDLRAAGTIGAETRFAYDAAGNLARVTDPNGYSTSYTYDGFGQVIARTSPDTGTVAVVRDLAGNIVSHTDARGVIESFSYDVSGRLTSREGPSAASRFSYRYDSAVAGCPSGQSAQVGRLSEVTHSRGSTRYCYTPFGEVARKIQTTDGVSVAVSYPL